MTEPRSSQFSIVAVLKLLTLLAMVFSIVPIALGYYWTVVVTAAAIGMFLAEHFPQPKSLGHFFLLLFPTLIAGLATIWPLLTAREPAAVADLILWFLIGILLGVVPVALSVVAISIFSSVVHRLTGIRLVKFEWGLAAESHQAAQQTDQREPESAD